jgi:hypothetical protein
VSGLLLDLINAGPEDDFVRTADVQSIISKFNGHPDSGGPWSFLNDLDQEVFAGDAAGVYATPDDGTHAPTRVLVAEYDLAVGMFIEFNSTTLGNLSLHYHVADGAGGTVDRRGRFSVCADGATYVVGATGGASTLNLAHTHSHSHTITHSHSHAHAAGALAGPSHSHSAGALVGPSHAHSHTHDATGLGVGGATGTSPEATNSVQSGGGATVNPTNHTHSNGSLDVTGTMGTDATAGGTGAVTGTTTSDGTGAVTGTTASDATGSSAGSSGTDATSGGSAAASIVPPYYAVTVLQKVA